MPSEFGEQLREQAQELREQSVQLIALARRAQEMADELDATRRDLCGGRTPSAWSGLARSAGSP